MKFYLSGPMSAIVDDNYPAFNRAAGLLRAAGHEVENPAEVERLDSWEAYMRCALRQMLVCDAVVMLPGWEGSRGALIELWVARKLKIEVVSGHMVKCLQGIDLGPGDLGSAQVKGGAEC